MSLHIVRKFLQASHIFGFFEIYRAADAVRNSPDPTVNRVAILTLLPGEFAGDYPEKTTVRMVRYCSPPQNSVSLAVSQEPISTACHGLCDAHHSFNKNVAGEGKSFKTCQTLWRSDWLKAKKMGVDPQTNSGFGSHCAWSGILSSCDFRIRFSGVRFPGQYRWWFSVFRAVACAP